MEIKLNVKEIFNRNEKFELKMFQVFNARNDLNMINVLLQKAEAQSESSFLFKIMLGILREAVMLTIEAMENYESEIGKFNNAYEIKELYKEFCRINCGTEEDSFSCKVLSNLRHQIFHYKETGVIKEILNNLSNDDATFEWDKAPGETEFTFINELFYGYFNKTTGSYIEKDGMNESIGIMTSYSTCVGKILDQLILGYLAQYTNFMDEGFDGKRIKRII